MRKRVYSLETEYALSFIEPTRLPVRDTSELYNLLEQFILARHDHARCDPTRSQGQSRPTSQITIELIEGYFLSNGARLYWDNGHLEWSAPEASDPYQAVLYDRSAEAELAAAVQAVQEKIGGRIMLVKNNLDYQTNSTYGCHENYSVRRYSDAGRNVLNQLEACLVPFLVTRQIMCGAGRLGAVEQPFAAFQLSQRADFTSRVSSVQTREDRPIVNRRDEPLADEDQFERLHLILGDSNLSEYANFLKLGATGLLLDMLEADADLPNLALHRPIEALHQVSRDLSFKAPLRLANGGSETALNIQRAYWQAACAFVEEQYGGDPMANQVLFYWDAVLQAIEQNHPDLTSYLDWASKRAILERFLDELSSDWRELEAWEPVLARTWTLDLPQSPASDLPAWLRGRLPPWEWEALQQHIRQEGLDWRAYPRMRQVAATLRMQDILYHDLNPQHSLFYCTEPFILIENQAEIENARRTPPADTRAVVRSQAICLAARQKMKIILDWHLIHLDRSNHTISLPDPLSNDLSVLEHWFGFHVQPTPPQPLPPDPLPPSPSQPDEPEIIIDILGVENLESPLDE